MTADFIAKAYEMKTMGKPGAGNPQVRFDKGSRSKPALYSTGSNDFLG